jgi:hypothetical protein
MLAYGEAVWSTDCTFSIFMLWLVEPLLDNDLETDNERVFAARQ